MPSMVTDDTTLLHIILLQRGDRDELETIFDHEVVLYSVQTQPLNVWVVFYCLFRGKKVSKSLT